MLKLGAIVPLGNGGIMVRFSFQDTEENEWGAYDVCVAPDDTSTDKLIARAYREMGAILDEWRGHALNMAGHYEAK